MAISKVLACFTHLFGLSRTECECTAVGRPDDADISQSGYYLDEIEGGINFESVENADCGSLWDKMEQARTIGIETMQRDITIALNSLYKQKSRAFNGNVGQPTATGVTANNKQYVGMRWRLQPYRDAEITISRFITWMDSDFSGELVILKGYQNAPDIPPTEIARYPFETVANMQTTHDITPLVLPMIDERLVPLDYYLVYQKPGNVQPRSNKASCNCGGSEALMKQYITPTGISADTLDTLPRGSADSFANGLQFVTSIACKSDLLICTASKENIEIFIAAAAAARNFAAAWLIEKVLNGGDVSRFTMMNREYLWGKRNHFKKDYNIGIDFIAENMNIENSDCYTCNDKRMFKGGIKI